MPRNSDYDRYVDDYDNSPSDSVRRKQVDVANKADAIIQNAQNDGQRELTTSETSEIDSLFASYEALGNDLKTMERVASMQSANRGIGRKTTPDGDYSGNGTSLRPMGYGGSYKKDSKFKALFPSADSDMSGFRDAQDFFKSVVGALTGVHDPRLFKNAGSSTDVGASGGFYVPQPIVGGLMDAVINQSELLNRVRVVPVTSKQTMFPRFNKTDRSQGIINGFNGSWVGEGREKLDVSTAAIEALTVTIDKFRIDTSVTSELLADAPTFVREFEPVLVESCVFELEDAIVRGSGVGMPVGLLNDAAGITTLATGGQSADTFTFANAAAMYASMYSGGFGRAVWLISPTVVPQLVTMPFTVANRANTETVGGSSAVTVGADESMLLLGRPVVVSQHLPILGDLGDVLFCDLSQYLWTMRKEVYIETNNTTY